MKIKRYPDSRALFLTKETAEQIRALCEQSEDIVDTWLGTHSSRGQMLGWQVSVRFRSTLEWYCITDANVEEYEDEGVLCLALSRT